MPQVARKRSRPRPGSVLAQRKRPPIMRLRLVRRRTDRDQLRQAEPKANAELEFVTRSAVSGIAVTRRSALE